MKHHTHGEIPYSLWEAIDPKTNEVVQGVYPATVEQQHWPGFTMDVSNARMFRWRAWIVPWLGEFIVRWSDQDDSYKDKWVSTEAEGIELIDSLHGCWSYTDMIEWLELNEFQWA